MRKYLLGIVAALMLAACIACGPDHLGSSAQPWFYVESQAGGYVVSIQSAAGSVLIISRQLSLAEATELANKLNADANGKFGGHQ